MNLDILHVFTYLSYYLLSYKWSRDSFKVTSALVGMYLEVQQRAKGPLSFLAELLYEFRYIVYLYILIILSTSSRMVKRFIYIRIYRL